MGTPIRTSDPVSATAPDREVVSLRSYRRVRRIAIALALVIAIPCILLVALLIVLNPAIRSAVESMGTDAVGVPVGLENVRVNIIGGVHLTRFSIGSPRGFREVRSFRFGQLDAEVAPIGLLGRTIEIQDILLVEPEITLEFDGKTFNWGVMMEKLVDKSKKPGEGGDGTKFVIHRFRIERPVVLFRAPSLPKGVLLRLRDIELQEIGSAPGSAATFSLVLATVVQALITGAIDEWAGIPGELGDILGDESARTSGALGDSFSRAKK